jgi:hypothetical protein
MADTDIFLLIARRPYIKESGEEPALQVEKLEPVTISRILLNPYYNNEVPSGGR